MPKQQKSRIMETPEFPPSRSDTTMDYETLDFEDPAAEHSSIGTNGFEPREYRFLGALHVKREVGLQVMEAARYDDDRNLAECFRERLETFPYMKALSTIQARLPATVDLELKRKYNAGDKDAFLIAAGTIVMNRNPIDMDVLANALEELKDLSELVHQPDSATSSRMGGSGIRANAFGQKPVPTNALDEDLLPLYRSKLNSLEMEGGEKLRFTTPVNRSLDPPQWFVSSWYNGQYFKAVAKRVKTAEQIIARDICHTFGYRL